jgi:hypothetical protein
VIAMYGLSEIIFPKRGSNQILFDGFIRLFVALRNSKSDNMVPNCSCTIARLCKKITILTSYFLFISISVISGQNQRQEIPPLRERIFFGGSFGLQFGTYTNINVTPMVGLWVRPRIAIAAGPNFTYYKDPYYKTTMYGGNAYVQFVPVRDINNAIPIGLHMGIFLHLEDELLSLESAVWDPQNPNTRFSVNTLLGGFGISQQLGVRSSVNLMFLWTLTDSGYTLYNNPEIRISFSF